MILSPRLQQITREDLTAADCREILDMEPRYRRLDLWYSHSQVRPGFCARFTAGPEVGTLAETAGHRHAIDAARAVSRALARSAA